MATVMSRFTRVAGCAMMTIAEAKAGCFALQDGFPGEGRRGLVAWPTRQ